jgi:hypothetical protein
MLLGHMIEGDLRLERQGNALIVHSKHNARWFGALVGSVVLIMLIRWISSWISMSDPSGPALLGNWFVVVLGVTFVGIGVFLSLPREVTTTFDLRSYRVVHHLSNRPWAVRAPPHLCLRGDRWLASERV